MLKQSGNVNFPKHPKLASLSCLALIYIFKECLPIINWSRNKLHLPQLLLPSHLVHSATPANLLLVRIVAPMHMRS
uniref:Uncharacterized protein n=1 Tax=Arundo donax TaxID=35708 RepID=A0A0A9H9E5_ARUDO